MATKRSAFGRDAGLQARMGLTMFLLGLLYAVLVGALIAASASAVVIIVIAVGLFFFQLVGSDKIALATLGAHEVSASEEPQLHAIIERLCIQADLPKPRVAVIEARMPNACALGRSQKSATVCATRGLLDLLVDPAELEGVLAHELTHVINRDVMVMTIASFFATHRRADHPLRLLLRRRLRRRRPRTTRRGDRARDPRLGARLRDLVRAAARALALPRVRRRPRLGDPHRPARARWPRR